MSDVKKKIEGWFAIASSYEYGPELVQYIGKGKPVNAPEAGTESLVDEDYFSFIDDGFFVDGKAYRLRIEVLEEIDIKEKP
jgi:hypothetical protein